MAESLSDLLTLADAYCVATHLSLSTVSERVLHGGNRLRDLRAGKGDIGVRRLQTAVTWFSENWPAGVDWPVGIERPAPAPSPEVAAS